MTLPVSAPATGLDPSWQIGLNWADMNDWSFGKDVVFTYGPLYYLCTGVLNMGHYCALFGELFLFYIITFALIILLVAEFSHIVSRGLMGFSFCDKFLLVTGCGIVVALPHYKLPETILAVSCIYIVRLVFENDHKQNNYRRILLIIAVLLGLASLIKFTYAIVGLLLIGCTVVALLLGKKWRMAVYLPVAFMISIVLFWILCGQPLNDLPYYYINGMEISLGYTEAMNVICNPVLYEVIYSSWMVIVMLAVGILFLFFALKRDWRSLFCCLIALPLLFMAFKEAGVRAGKGRIEAISSQVLPVFVFLCSTFIVKKIRPAFKTLLCVIPMVTLIVGALPTHRVLPDNTILRGDFPPIPPQYLDSIGNSSIDIIPWEISLLYSYNLNWKPRPTIQSYAAWTSKLDILDAENYNNSAEAPEFILYNRPSQHTNSKLPALQSIDNRYLLFDEPATFRALLANYETDCCNNDYLLLKQTTNSKQQTTSNKQQTIICSITYRMGDTIAVPQIEGYHLFGNIQVKMTIWGKLLNLLYKPGKIYITFYLKNDTTNTLHQYRLVRNVANDGLLLSKYVVTLQDLASIFDDNYVADIEKIQITADNPILYDDEIKCSFYSIKFRK